MKTINLYNGQPQRGPLIRWKVAIWFLAVPFVLTLVGALISVWPAASAQPSGSIIMIATTTPQPASPAPIASRAIVGYFDFAQPTTAAPLTEADIVRVIGQAVGDWRLVELESGARVWVRAADVPAGIPADTPLADLTPATPQPAQQAPIVVAVPVAPAPPDCGPRPAGDKWVCSTDGRGWILPGIEDWMATAPIEVQAAEPSPIVQSRPETVTGCGGPRCGWQGKRP
jgi:hypothetical protein